MSGQIKSELLINNILLFLQQEVLNPLRVITLFEQIPDQVNVACCRMLLVRELHISSHKHKAHPKRIPALGLKGRIKHSEIHIEKYPWPAQSAGSIGCGGTHCINRSQISFKM